MVNGQWGCAAGGRPAGELVGGYGGVGLVSLLGGETQGVALGWYMTPRWGWGTFFVPQARDYEGHDGIA